MYNKSNLINLVANEIDGQIHKMHIISIINILIEEICNDLLAGKEVKIKNFGTFRLSGLKSKKIISVISKEPKFTKKSSSLRFRMARKFYNYIHNMTQEIIKGSIKICEEKDK